MKQTLPLTPVERKTVGALSGIFALRMVGLFMILPIFSKFAIQLNHVTPTLIGVAAGIYGLTQALLQIPFGLASDRWGRKPLIMLGLLFFIAGSILAASSSSIYGVMMGRALQGGSAIGCVMMALVADVTRPEIRVKAMGVIGMTIAFSFALAMLLGPLLNSMTGGRGIFWASAFLGIVAIFVLITFVPAPKASFPQEASLKVEFLLTLWKHPQLSVLNLGGLVVHISLIALFLKLPQMVERVGILEEKLWQFYWFLFAGSLLTAGLYFFLLERKVQGKVGLISVLLLLILSEVGMAFFLEKRVVLLVALWLFFTAFNVLEAMLPAWIALYAPKERKGTAMGVYSSAQFLGMFLGGVIGGWLDTNYGMVAVLLLCIILAIVWILVSSTIDFERGLSWQEG